MRISSHILGLCMLLAAFTNSIQEAKAQGKISQFERAGMCDFLIDKSGVYHAVFQESPANGKPTFIYYASSSNKGATWSKPFTISNDNTGNGSSYARILQDGNGQIYAIWKRFGKTSSQYPVPDVTLDGPGGYSWGTLFYKVLNGGAWSDEVQLNEQENIQETWMATVSPAGKVCVFFNQLSDDAVIAKATGWIYADYLRRTELNGTSHTAYVSMSNPSKATYAGGYPAEAKGIIDLSGYVDATGAAHLAYENNIDNVENIKYYDGKTIRVIYSYPKYGTFNSFNNPPKLLHDEKGVDHIIFLPAESTLESEQLWDFNLATNKTTVLASLQQQGVKISGFQASQGPNGTMAVTFEAGEYSGNHEAYGSFYKNGVWTNLGLTKNASKEKFFSKEFQGLGGYRTIIASLTRYSTIFGSVAYDAMGKKSMLMTINAYWTSGGYSVSSPSLVFVPID